MKKLTLQVFGIAIACLTVNSAAGQSEQQQRPEIGCGTKSVDNTPNAYTEFVRNGGKVRRKTNQTYVIPVIFHVLYTNTTQAQMACRIEDAIAVLNEDYTGNNSDYNSTDPRFSSIKQIMPDVEFCAATIDPNGNTLTYPGMHWVGTNVVSDGYDNNLYNYLWYGVNGKYYLDVAVVNDPNSTGTNGSGHSWYPNQNVQPHIVYNYRYIGRTCGSQSASGFESVMSHEVGHYFGLEHTFETGCSGDGDGIADTPLTTGSEGCGHDFWGQCSNYVNTENYMDYNYSCYAMFTQGQVDAMYFWMQDNSQAYYLRARLWSASNLAAVGCGGAVMPTADFTASTTYSCDGSVSFTDQSANADTWKWSFGDGGTSNQQDPTHQYANAGTYTVKLVVTNTNGQDSLSKTGLITVAIPVDPVTSDDTVCSPVTAHLTSTSPGNGTLNWYDASSGGNLVNTGTTYDVAPTTTTTYYVEEDLRPAPVKGGPTDNTFGAGANYNTADRRLFFDVLKASTLKSVKVYATGAGNRTIEVLDGNGIQVAKKTVQVPDGESRVTLDFNLPVGTNYAIKCNTGNGELLDLYRNSAGPAYPYNIGNLMSITGSDASGNELTYYYFFYDWEVQEQGCISNRIPVTATVNVCTGTPSFDPALAYSVFPNPHTNSFFITYNGEPNNQVTVQVLSLTGQEVTGPMQLQRQTEIHLDHAGPGIYLLRFQTAYRTDYLRIVRSSE
ncbi:MAG: T9SS type A sorting domain-containing protein [Flavobacteriales bacterium]|nr:T9SS type A sorting domain-containing protein [Flavobacteriales bacterium]MCB9447230.1 T9SS type A sorting domain-containing protein [Flavobacteriales bacterium]